MDNVESIIVVLFIIFSIFSSIMKKKKKLESSKRSKEFKSPPKKQGILSMLEEFNKTMGSQNQQNKSSSGSEVDAYFLENEREAKKLAAIDNLEKIQAKKARISYSNFIEPTTSIVENTKYDLAFDQAETELNLVNHKLHNIKRLIQNPKTLREYVIMKEILDKPRALQEY